MRGVKLLLIELGEPNRNAYIESFNGRFRDGCSNEHWFISLPHARAVVDAWRRGYNEERPKSGFGGLTLPAYTKQLTAKAITLALSTLKPAATDDGQTSTSGSPFSKRKMRAAIGGLCPLLLQPLSHVMKVAVCLVSAMI